MWHSSTFSPFRYLPLLGLVLTSACSKAQTTPMPPQNVESPIVALSLDRLQSDLATCGQKCPGSLERLGGLTRLVGYVSDPEHHDLLLLGFVDSTFPSIPTGDLVVALRNAWLQYASLQGDGVLYSFPSCDIRPDPTLARRLQSLQVEISQQPKPNDAERWRRACASEQQVSVFGIPPDTHFGQVMVAADYDMKKLADGSDAPEISGLTSLGALRLAEVRKAIEEDRPITLRSGSQRFWLAADENEYATGSGSLLLQWSPVKVSTRPTVVDSDGAFVDTEGSDLLADDFAGRISQLYDALAHERSIYRELENLFHLTSLAAVLHQREEPRNVGINLDFLLTRYNVSQTPVRRTVPGWPGLREYLHESSTATSRQILRVQLPSCGGVEIRIEPQPEWFRPSSQDLSELDRLAREARPARGVTWPVPMPAEVWGRIERDRRLRQLNRSHEALILELRDAGASYYLSDGAERREYRDFDTGRIAHDAVAMARLKGATTVYLMTRDFSLDRQAAFDLDLRTHGPRTVSEARFIPLHDVSEATETLWFKPGWQITTAWSPAERIPAGPFKDYFRRTATFTKSVGGQIVNATVEIVGRTLELLERFLEIFNLHFQLTNSLAYSLAGADFLIRQELRKTDPSIRDLDAFILAQLSGIHRAELGERRREIGS